VFIAYAYLVKWKDEVTPKIDSPMRHDFNFSLCDIVSLKTKVVACMENVQINMGSEVHWDLVLSHSHSFDFVSRKGTQKIFHGSVLVPAIFVVTSLTTLPPVLPYKTMMLWYSHKMLIAFSQISMMFSRSGLVFLTMGFYIQTFWFNLISIIA